VGSSSSTISGSLTSERAMVSRRFIPPDSGSTLLSARSVSWTKSSSSSARRRATRRGMPKNLAYVVRFSRTLSSMSRLSSWGQTPRRARMRGPSRRGSMPRISSTPPVGGETQPIMRMVELLPAPLGPRKPNASPRRTSTSMPSTAVQAPNRLTRPRA
jgi:hypothetical protein